MARGAAVAVGNFDGLHRGHQAVIAEARSRARALGARAAVLTFDPHPRRIFRPNDPPFELTPLTTKVRVLAALGVDELFVLRFDETLARLSAGDFIAEVLVDGIGARHVVCGDGFVFGRGRLGTVATLTEAARNGGFTVAVVEPVRQSQSEVFSSTTIRQAIAAGEPRRAAELLGRCWEIEGRVQTGDRRGRTIGFPTANLVLGDYIEPLLGVYAVWAGLDRAGRTQWHPGVANIGRRPTFDGAGITVETYIFDFQGDIYGEVLRVALADFVRPERKFDGIEAIRRQIANDCRAARIALGTIAANTVLGPPDAALLGGAR